MVTVMPEPLNNLVVSHAPVDFGWIWGEHPNSQSFRHLCQAGRGPRSMRWAP